ncbi:hypothetical protein TK90_2884 (plasmid) [Thioalkalivibrio sp. K90mix]|nr:hypothetical protein [Thioalkalivibrio sp. K90mix]ADC73093.1 hypothetical protein TK90_2604 [Thioalkalivibrio sp. K90mix]ADC73368.1 hypothetical protein TK90_2884 [Thioalkalivibrio sp. K90mix]
MSKENIRAEFSTDRDGWGWLQDQMTRGRPGLHTMAALVGAMVALAITALVEGSVRFEQLALVGVGLVCYVLLSLVAALGRQADGVVEHGGCAATALPVFVSACVIGLGLTQVVAGMVVASALVPMVALMMVADRFCSK